MADYTFNTEVGQTIDRELLILCLNTGTAESPVWSPLGKRVEDSSADYDWAKETKQDILGSTYTTMKKPVITQSFDPCELDKGDAAQQKLWKMMVVDQDAAALCALDCLVVHAYAGFGERYDACAIENTSIGGAGGGAIGMPIEVTLGGKRTKGAATVNKGVVSFTAET